MRVNTLQKSIKSKLSYEKTILIGILVLTACTRLIALGQLPDGILPDEAYAAYNAYALMTEGIDSRGYAFPVYFTAWGSGMSVLYSYLLIPLFTLFGTSLTVVRLPQALVGIASVYAAYVLGKQVYNAQFGCLFAFLLAINPWHIMNMRFGLDANMAPGMLLIGLCFFVLGIRKKAHYLLLAALFFAATLYCYVLSWIALPVLLLLCLIVYRKWIPHTWHTFAAVGLLFVLAVPLLLFVAINLEWIPEIRTSFFSIPKLAGLRSSELDPRHMLDSFKDLVRVLLRQHDYAPHTSSADVGIYYFFSTPFIVLGVCVPCFRFLRRRLEQCVRLQLIWLLWGIGAFLVCILQENITVIHINLIHIPMIAFGAIGIYEAASYCKHSAFLPICMSFLCLSFGVFLYHYISEPTTYFFDERADEAIEAAKDLADGDLITLVEYPCIKYSVLMWHEKPSPSHFSQNVVYTGDPAWAELETYESFRYISNIQEADGEGVYLFAAKDREQVLFLGYEITEVNDRYFLAVKRGNTEDRSH